MNAQIPAEPGANRTIKVVCADGRDRLRELNLQPRVIGVDKSTAHRGRGGFVSRVTCGDDCRLVDPLGEVFVVEAMKSPCRVEGKNLVAKRRKPHGCSTQNYFCRIERG